MTKIRYLLPLLLGMPMLTSCSALWQSIDDIRDVPETRGTVKAFPYEFADVLPVVLDESVRDPLGLEIFGEYADGVNLKISKCGGIRSCYTLPRRARQAGLDLMMGCMIESSLGIAQGLQLGTLLRWADLDGFLLIREDPYTGIAQDAGRLTANGEPGLGLRRRAR